MGKRVLAPTENKTYMFPENPDEQDQNVGKTVILILGGIILFIALSIALIFLVH